jgi:hypothetical protein
MKTVRPFGLAFFISRYPMREPVLLRQQK